jgi:hypothetical protein
MAVSAIYGGVSANNSAKANAKATELAAFVNSRNSVHAGLINSAATLQAAKVSNAVNTMAATFGAEQTWDVAQYNADLKFLIGDYNADLLDSEAVSILEGAKIDIKNMEDAAARSKGAILASYGASGAQINETDSVAEAIIDSETQFEINKFIIRHGADIQVTKIRNEAARSRWDGYVAAQQVLYEGGQKSKEILFQGAINNMGGMAQSGIDASAIMANARIGAANITNAGGVDAQKFRIAGNQAMNDGLFKAGASTVGGTIDSKTASLNTGTPASAPDFKVNGPSNISNTQYGNYSGSLLTS